MALAIAAIGLWRPAFGDTSVKGAAAAAPDWTGTWGVAPQSSGTTFNQQTIRQIVHTSIGGSKARVVLSNAYGTGPVTIGAAHLALRDKEGAIQTAAGGALTFSVNA